jgi:hypothetical protein
VLGTKAVAAPGCTAEAKMRAAKMGRVRTVTRGTWQAVVAVEVDDPGSSALIFTKGKKNRYTR